MSKYSAWFNDGIKPAHIGIYEISPSNAWWGCRWFRRWDGKKWIWGGRTPQIASQETQYTTFSDGERWRGLARKPT